MICEVCLHGHGGRGQQCAACADFDARWNGLTFDEQRAEIAEMGRHTSSPSHDATGAGEGDTA